MFPPSRFFGQLTDSMIFLVHWKRCAGFLRKTAALPVAALLELCEMCGVPLRSNNIPHLCGSQ